MDKPKQSIEEFLKDTSRHTTCQIVDVTKEYLGKSFVFMVTAPKPKKPVSKPDSQKKV